MNQEDLSHLPTEIAVLQKIVRVLLQQNDALQAENSMLKQQIAASRSIHSPTDTTFEGIQLTHPPSIVTLGVSEIIDSASDTEIATNQTIRSLSDLPEGTGPKIHSLSETRIAAKQTTEKDLEVGLGMNRAALSNSESGSGMNQETYQLPVRLDVSGLNTSGLATILMQAGVGNGKRSTARTAAALIIHFYNEQPGEYKHLKRLTSYSDGGLGKMLMMLRRKGYLIKCGFQQHAVAANGIKALREAKCK